MAALSNFLLIFLVSLISSGYADETTTISGANTTILTTSPPKILGDVTQRLVQRDTVMADDQNAIGHTHASTEAPLGLHGITEQQLNMKFYNFICSSHYHLDCKITETLQICIKGNYVAVLGLPLAFEKDSTDLKMITKWMRQCDGNDQEMNQEAMKVIRKRIRYQNEQNWTNVFKSSATIVAIFNQIAPIILAILVVFP